MVDHAAGEGQSADKTAGGGGGHVGKSLTPQFAIQVYVGAGRNF
jgi:hypothetical protein